LSDIVVGALIGVVATALGSIIIGIINYKRSKSQQRYNEQQAQIDRLVRDRERVLVPLREVMSKWMQITKQDQQMLVRLEKAYNERNNNPQELERELERYKETAEKSTQVTSELAVLQGQISDSVLDQMIEAAKKAHWETAPERTKLVQLFNNPQNMDTNSLLSAVEKYDSILNNLRGYLLTVNKRIEELLSGEPST